jgi:transcriptional regulator NrdR family protein
MAMKDADNPPTARELAARSNGTDLWTCRFCGCKDWRVETSRPIGEVSKERYRVCRHCGQDRRRTEEVPVPRGFKVIVVPDEERDVA